MQTWQAEVKGTQVKAGETKFAYSLAGGKLSKQKVTSDHKSMLRPIRQLSLLSKKRVTWVIVLCSVNDCIADYLFFNSAVRPAGGSCGNAAAHTAA